MITIGYQHVSINDINEYSLWNVEGTVIIKGKAGFGAGTKIAVGKGAKLTLGDNFLITARSEIACFKEITFGDNCLKSWNVLLIDADAHPIFDENENLINDQKHKKIGNKVWIGCRTLTLKGTEIPDNCIIGANSLVNRKFTKEKFNNRRQPC
jgi:acetyltransferase-like isoleucine patch superfamily enzyme